VPVALPSASTIQSFALLGFWRDGGLTFQSQYFSPEQGSNTAMLYGLVSSEPIDTRNPEPATMILLATGLGAIAVIRRRTHRNG